MEVDNFDNFDAPQFFDFANDFVSDDIDKYFDVDHEKSVGGIGKRASSLPPSTPAKNKIEDVSSPACNENKENFTPPTERRRSSSVPPSCKSTARGVLADISCSSTYMTPSAARKSTVSYLNNGRSVLVQKYEGIQLITPNKTHPMETRLDLTINSPGLSLRTRSISKPMSLSKSAIPDAKTDEIEDVEMEEQQPEEIVEKPNDQINDNINLELENKEVQPVIKKGRSVVILPAQQPPKPASAIPKQTAKPQPAEQKKPNRIRHTAPVVAQFRPVATKPDSAKSKFHATAELVRKFHKSTPDRFHSVPANQKPQVRQSPIVHRPNTIPKSPFLASKMRVRNEYIPSQADKEKAEIDEMKKHQIKAKPVPRQILVPPVQKNIAVAKILPTKPEPFKLTQIKRKEATPEPVYSFKANPVPRKMLQSPQGVPARQEIPLTEPHTPALSLNAKYPKRPKLDGMDLKKIGHGGVPIVKQMTPGKLTQVQPFSFEERDKEIQQKRMELVQKQIEEEKTGREFRASKLPNFARAPLLPEKKQFPITIPHTPNLSGFTLGAKNQQKFYEKLAEEEQKMQEALIFKAKPATVTQVEPFRPILPHRVISDVAPISELNLNTEKRAHERAKFEEMLRMQEQAQEESRKMLEQLKEEEARLEEIRMRKETEFHANPVRTGTPFKVKPSEKPLTETLTPKFRIEERLAKH